MFTTRVLAQFNCTTSLQFSEVIPLVRGGLLRNIEVILIPNQGQNDGDSPTANQILIKFAVFITSLKAESVFGK